MNASVRKRLSAWLSVSILIAGVLAAALSFSLAYQEANELQDTQLQQVAAVLADNALSAAPRKFEPRNNEDAEAHYVIKLLGPSPLDPNPAIDVPLPESLQPGLQSLEQSGVRWRVLVTRNNAGQRFA